MSAPKTIAYLRVSTNHQDLDKNEPSIHNLANEEYPAMVHFVEEAVSGTAPGKERKLATIIDEFGAGGNLIVSELSRLDRSMLGGSWTCPVIR